MLMSIKFIQDGIIKTLSEFKEIKIISVPVMNFDNVRQDIILNIRYIGEKFISLNSNNMSYGDPPTNARISDVSFEVEIYYKDLRNKFEEIYDLINKIISKLHGVSLSQSGKMDLSPLFINSIEFKERTPNSFIVYKFLLEVRRTIQ